MAEHIKHKLMKASEIPDFVDDVIKTGCNICAVGHDKYLIGEADLPALEQERVGRKLAKIDEIYGDRDFLKLEIVSYLRSIGRYLDVGADGAG
ncbi:hypothetical protein ILFOPFJJ_03901 [Ensifer psoraleae]|uniref:hypothetical protein n=1 Tax=Sinorhizobium TaxID=28105 RepID=UPI0015692552|nr:MULTISPECIES: hypothetical protein [Sinorhizobium]MDK1385876.1 hypothetical protein [Sinorhizobium sp. 7-81]NRP73002.1 hypothetical protein [Sinorhizobium psoraleae]